MNTQILFSYLRAASLYGEACRPVTRELCKDVLGICDVDNAVVQLRAQGHQITVNDRGEIRISGVQE